MKKRLIVFAFFLICATAAYSQEDTALLNRLNIVLNTTRKLDFETLLDYTYPKLYELVTKEQMKEVLKSSFESEEFSITLDSLNILKIHPIFTIAGEQYCRIVHTMTLRMKFNEPVDTTDEEAMTEREEMADFMKAGFEGGLVRYDRKTDAIVVKESADLVAIRPKTDNKWYFVTYDKDSPQILNFLFSKPVIEKIESYK